MIESRISFISVSFLLCKILKCCAGTQRDETVLVVDRRHHIAGNAFDRFDSAWILIHQYGPHIFHTNSDNIFEHLSHFTKWRRYEHRVLAQVDRQLLPIPINLDTINWLYGLSLNSEQMEKFLVSRAEHVENIMTSEDVVVSKLGRELYEKIFSGLYPKAMGSGYIGKCRCGPSHLQTWLLENHLYRIFHLNRNAKVKICSGNFFAIVELKLWVGGVIH